MTDDPASRTCSTCGAPSAPGTRFCAMCGAALATFADHEAVRRPVVVLFADLAGFTSMGESLDPEVLRAIMDRYFRLASKVIWGHGGTTEKFIGDAVMAVFGMPVSHEDDALRAVQAACDIIEELKVLNRDLSREFGIGLQVRIGVCSGLVPAAYDASGDFRVIGDTVNTASRLQSAAEPGQVLVGEAVAQLVQPHLQLAEVPALALKGKEEPVRAWSVTGQADPASATRHAPLIGRDIELIQLRRAYDRMADTGRGTMATLIGPPGIGKTRLAAELQAAAGDPGPVVISGRAHSYGRGITYWPIVEMLASAPGAWTSFASRASAEPGRARARSCLAALSNTSGEPKRDVEVEEIAWALRTFVAAAAASGPVLLIWEDMHWAEPTLLDVIEYLHGELQDTQVMQLCLARPELRDARPDLLGGSASAMTLELAPLTMDETWLLVSELTSCGEVAAQDLDAVSERAVLACEGNPLFAELMLDMDDDASTPMPHAISAVFAARLDRLQAEDRLILEMAAVGGRDFTSADLRHLLALDGRASIDLAGTLDRLRRARLLTGNQLSARHSFAQAFCRDTTYDLTAKRNRLRWHLALADRAERSAPETNAEAGELLSYHLESAALLSRELQPLSSACAETGRRAGAALSARASDAMNRRDLRAAVGLLERALLVLPAASPGWLQLTLKLSDTWLGLGDAGMAQQALGEPPSEDPAAAGNSDCAIEIQRVLIDLRLGRRKLDQVLDAEQRLRERIAASDNFTWCRLHQLSAHRNLMAEHVGAAEESLATALEYAIADGDAYEADRVHRAATELTVWGPTPVAHGLARCREQAEIFADSRVSMVPILGTMAALLALDGQFDQARENLDTAEGYAADLRMRGAHIGLTHLRGLLESLRGDHESAASSFSGARDVLLEAGQADGAALLGAYAARELVAAGSPVPAHYAALTDADLAALHDPRTGALTLALCARAAADDSDTKLASDLARRAIRAADEMDDPFFQGSVYQDVAITMAHAGRPAEAAAAAETARSRYLAKGSQAAAAQLAGLMSREPGLAPGRPIARTSSST